MKVTRKTQPTYIGVTLELTEEEALYLKAITGRMVSNGHVGSASSFSGELFNALPEYSIAEFELWSDGRKVIPTLVQR